MRDYLAHEVRNICLLGHSGAGKTALLEAMLFYTNSTDRFGKTSEGSSIIDYDPEEVKRGFSIYTSIAPVEWNDCKINFIDTPGYLDFMGELQQGIHVADNALIVVGAKDGIQTGTEKAFNIVNERKIPTVFFVNKIDEENASFEQTYEQLRERFGKTVIAFEVPIIEKGEVIGNVNVLQKRAFKYGGKGGSPTEIEIPAHLHDEVDLFHEQIKEALAMCDDELMDRYFSGEEFTQEEIAKGVRLGVRSGDIRPVFCGSATKLSGISRLMDLIIKYFPSYAEKGAIEALDAKTQNTIKVGTNESEDFSAFVFKTIIDPFVGRISFLKVMSGVLTTDSQVYNVQKEKMEKINQLFVLKGKYQLASGKLFTGDLGAVVKLQVTTTNDTLATKEKQIIFPDIQFTQPMLGMAVWPKSKNDEDKLSTALQRMAEEDLSCRVETNKETKETVLYGIGDQHIDVILNKLRSKYKVEVELTEPKVPYRETIKAKVLVEGRHKKQSGGHGQFGHVFVEFEPTDSEEMIFEERVFGGSVPRQYFPAVEVGLRECMNKGVLAGFKVVGVKATLTDGKYHDVDSSEMAFKLAARLAYKAGIKAAKPILLEPIVDVEVKIPEEYTGTIMGDFNKRRGSIVGMDLHDGLQIIKAEVPMNEMMRYATELRSMTQGRGEYTQQFNRYDSAPQPIATKVIAQAVKEEDDEE